MDYVHNKCSETFAIGNGRLLLISSVGFGR